MFCRYFATLASSTFFSASATTGIALNRLAGLTLIESKCLSLAATPLVRIEAGQIDGSVEEYQARSVVLTSAPLHLGEPGPFRMICIKSNRFGLLDAGSASEPTS